MTGILKTKLPQRNYKTLRPVQGEGVSIDQRVISSYLRSTFIHFVFRLNYIEGDWIVL